MVGWVQPEWYACCEASIKKAAEAALSGRGSGLCRLLLFLGAGLGLVCLFRFLHCLVELAGHQLDAVLLDAVFVGPLFRLQIALDGEQRALFQQLERCAAALAPGFHAQESGYTGGFIAFVSLRPIANGKRATSLLVNVRISASFATKPVMTKEFSTCFMIVSF